MWYLHWFFEKVTTTLCMIIWKNYVFDKPLLAYTHLTFREEWVLLFFHQPVFPFQWLATGRGFSPSIKDKEDGSYHTRTDLLPIKNRSQYKLNLYVFKALRGLAPLYLTELVKPYVPSRSRLSQSASLLQVPTTRTKTHGNRRFDKTASNLWSNIPLLLKTVDSLSAFKSCLKAYFFKQAFRL